MLEYKKFMNSFDNKGFCLASCGYERRFSSINHPSNCVVVPELSEARYLFSQPSSQ